MYLLLQVRRPTYDDKPLPPDSLGHSGIPRSLGIKRTNKKCYTRLADDLNKIVEQFDPQDPLKTLKKIWLIWAKMGDAFDMPP